MAPDTTTLRCRFVADQVHSTVAFSVPAMAVSNFRSGFDKVQAHLDLTAEPGTLTGSVEINSLALREPPQFRGHLLSNEFFAAEQFPTAGFESDLLELHDDGTIAVSGRLTLKGITVPISAIGRWSEPVSDASGKSRTHLSLETILNRRDFAMTFDSQLPGGESGLGDEVTVTVELAFIEE